jgi:hypothetical protein
MNLTFVRNKDFWSGVMLLAIGLTALVLARDYPFGTSLRMGPGYFPIVLGVLLALFGVYFIVLGLRSSALLEGHWSLRALIILPLSLVAFGVLMDRAGFIPALAVLVVGSAAAGRDFRVGEVLLLAFVLIFFCVVLFISGIGLPYRLFVG